MTSAVSGRIAASTAFRSMRKSGRRSTSSSGTAATSHRKRYMPKVGGQLTTRCPGPTSARTVSSISSSDPAPPTTRSGVTPA